MCNCGTDEKFDGSNSFWGRLQLRIAEDNAKRDACCGFGSTRPYRKYVDSVVIEPKQLTS